jgi:hypothetical protein
MLRQKIRILEQKRLNIKSPTKVCQKIVITPATSYQDLETLIKFENSDGELKKKKNETRNSYSLMNSEKKNGQNLSKNDLKEIDINMRITKKYQLINENLKINQACELILEIFGACIKSWNNLKDAKYKSIIKLSFCSIKIQRTEKIY